MQFMFVPEGIDLRQVSVAEAARWAISAIESPD
jgi:hypothetical protein